MYILEKQCKEHVIHEAIATKIKHAKPKEKIRIRAMFNDKYKTYVI